MNDLFTKKNLFLIRGLPGSGKTTIAKLLSENGKYSCFTVDDFFTNENGDYHFEFDKNYLAYEQCAQNTQDAMKRGEDKIFVHNTFVYDWEMEPYIQLAKSFEYTLFVLTTEKFHSERNIHAVNDAQLQKMADKYKVKLF